jgi:1,4-dihydroxy-2-naphthoate octaprenyltransferase
VLVGTALAWKAQAFDLVPALAALVTALLLQIASNLANDYFDFVRGADRVGRRGPARAAQSGLISLTHLRIGIGLVFASAALVGTYLVSVGGWPVLALGVAALLSAFAYTGGPFPLGYHGLGDLFVFLFFGFAAVCGTYYVQALTITTAALAAAVCIGLLTTAILVVNNLRDIETDREIGKRTLAVMLGPRATALEYILILVGAYLIPPLLWLEGWASGWVMLPLLSFPWALRLMVALYRSSRSHKPSEGEGPRLNRILARTAGLDLGFSILFSLGLVL